MAATARPLPEPQRVPDGHRPNVPSAAVRFPAVRDYEQVDREIAGTLRPTLGWFAALGVWQMVWYVALRGWPFARIRRRAVRLVTAHVAVIACGWASYLVAERVLGVYDRVAAPSAGRRSR